MGVKQTFFYSLTSVVALGGFVWAGGGGGCSSSDPAGPAATTDSGAASSSGSSGGGDSGSGTSDSSTTSDTGTSSSSSGDTGTKGVPITYGKCPDFTKCATDPKGSWTVSGGCLSSDTFAEAKNQCPGLKESNVILSASGTVSVNATTVVRKTTTSLTASVLIPKSCAQGANCAQVGLGLTAGLVPGVPQFQKADCKDDAAKTSCNCDVETSVDEDVNAAYESALDGTLTTKEANGDRTFDYCVVGNKLTFQETTAVAGTLPFIVEVTK